MAKKDGEWKMLSFAPAIKYYETRQSLVKSLSESIPSVAGFKQRDSYFTCNLQAVLFNGSVNDLSQVVY